MSVEDNRAVLNELITFYNTLDRKKTATEYTANETQIIAKAAIKIITAYPDADNQLQSLKDQCVDILHDAIAIAESFYDNYDFTNRTPKPGAPNPLRAVSEAKDGIEFFVKSVQENGHL